MWGLMGILVFMPSLNFAAVPKATILVLGDSLSAAHGMDVEAGWVALLEQKLDENVALWQVVNASTSGETTQGGRHRLPALLAWHEPEICIIELGANDGLRGLDLGHMRTHLGEMIGLCRTYQAAVLLIGMKLPPNYGAHYANAFAESFARLAASHDVPLVPFLLEGVALDPTLMQEDRLHPNAAAQARLLQNVWPQLSPLLTLTVPDPRG